MSNSRRENLSREITLHERRLQILREKRAIKGIDTEPHVIIEIEDIEQELENLYAELGPEKEPVVSLESSSEFLSTQRVIPKLKREKCKFLYFTYVESQTDVYSRIEVDNVANFMELPQPRILSIGRYLNQAGLIRFTNWVQGVWIKHRGIVRIETDLFGMKTIPDYASIDEIKKIEQRFKSRLMLLHHVYQKSKGNTFEKISHVEIADSLGIDHNQVISQLIPYLDAEGLVKVRTNDSIAITEEGIDKVEELFD